MITIHKLFLLLMIRWCINHDDDITRIISRAFRM